MRLIVLREILFKKLLTNLGLTAIIANALARVLESVDRHVWGACVVLACEFKSHLSHQFGYPYGYPNFFIFRSKAALFSAAFYFVNLKSSFNPRKTAICLPAPQSFFTAVPRRLFPRLMHRRPCTASVKGKEYAGRNLCGRRIPSSFIYWDNIFTGARRGGRIPAEHVRVMRLYFQQGPFSRQWQRSRQVH